MAPPKRKAQQVSEDAPPMRLTRAAAKRAADSADAPPVEEVLEKKTAKKGKGFAKQKKDKKENEGVLGQSESQEEKEEGVDASENVLEASNNKKTILVEYWYVPLFFFF